MIGHDKIITLLYSDKYTGIQKTVGVLARIIAI